MNYYERHLGDYCKDTAHLTLVEHGAYCLLLDRYYGTELGIPADQAHRIARARTKEEKQAVDVVLAEFFQLVDGVWMNKRAEEEIAKARAKIAAAQGNGRKGGRPKKHLPGPENETQEKPTGFSVGSENETQQKAHQTPDTRHQLTPTSSPESELPRDEQPPATSFPESLTQPAQWLAWFNAEQGLCLDPISRFDRKGFWPLATAWCKAGVTQSQMREAIATAKASATEAIAYLPAYVDRVLASQGAPPKPMSASDASKLAAARTIFGTEIEGNENATGRRIIDITPATSGAMGCENLSGDAGKLRLALPESVENGTAACRR